MDAELVSFTGLTLMFVLGLRHGLDPDHIACIDALTWRALSIEQRHAPWIGTLFAIGHGLLVTVIAVVVSQVAHAMTVPALVVHVLDWVPTALLLLVGTINLRMLLRAPASFQPTGWKLRLIPARLRHDSSPWAVIATGVLFATVFDTATQASAWGYVAANKGGMAAALAAGLVFTAGMVVTDTLDGRLICRVSRSAHAATVGPRVRRALGWLIVALSYGVAAYNIAKALAPAVELDDLAFSLTGGAMITLMALLWAGMRIAHGRRLIASGPPAGATRRRSS